MLIHRATRRRRTAGAVAIGLGLILLIAVPASAAAPTLTASLTPGTAGAGSPTQFALNVSSDQGTLQSLTLGAPNGFYVGSASSTSGNASVSGNQTVNVTGLKISGSAVLTVTIAAWPECTPTPANTWNLTAIQKGGTAYVPQSFSTAVSASTSCRLVFGTMADQIKNVSSPVVVAAVRANGFIDTTYIDAISLSKENDPGLDDATLTGGSTPTTYTGGVATFSTSLDFAGTGYTLEACSPTINGEPCDQATGDSGAFLSGLFAVYDAQSACHNGQSCFVTAPGQQVSIQVSVQGQNNKFLKAGTFAVPEAIAGGPGDLSNLDCPGYDEITETVTSFDFTGTGAKIVTDIISADQMKEIANQGVSFLQGCFGSSIQFIDRSGNPAVFNPTLGLYVGLLRDCPPSGDPEPSAPCVISRTGGGQGTGQFRYIAAALDPGGARH
jgi:hypothetical protein